MGIFNMSSKRIRFLMAKTGSDIHDRGARVVSMALRDAGVEVIYAGLFRTPDEIIEAAIQEDVDCIGVSILDGTHMTIVPELMQAAKQKEILDRIFIIGGAITAKEEIQLLKEYMSESIGVEDGEIIAASKGLHLYDYIWELAKLRTMKLDKD